MTPHQLIPRLAARRALDAATRAAARCFTRDDFRDDALRLADDLRLRGAVVARLCREGIVESPDAAESVRHEMDGLRRRAATQDMERERVLARLRRAGIAPVLLKGSALRVTHYAEPAERASGDIDLLVRRDEVADTVAALVDAGYAAPSADDVDAYARFHFHFALAHPRWQVVEVHWALTEPESPVQLDADAVLAAAREIPRVQLTALRVPADEDMLLHLASQCVADPRRLLARAVDVDRIVGDGGTIAWERVVRDARTSGAATALWVLLGLARCQLHVPVPDEVLRALRPSRLVRANLRVLRVEARATRVIATDDSEQRLVQLWMLADARGVGAALRWLLLQGFSGPRARARDSRARTPRRSLRARDALALAAAQLRVYLGGHRRHGTSRTRDS